MRKLLTQLVSEITRHPRYQPEIVWSSTSWTHNIFRAYEYLFGRRYGIRPEISAIPHGNKTYYYAHSWEASFAIAETIIRNAFAWRPAPFRVYIPIMQMPGGVQIPVSPFLFAIAVDTATQGATATGSPKTWNHTCTGSDLMLFIQTAINSSSQTTTSVTYNASAATDAGVVATYTTGGGKSQIFYKLSPSTGSNQISCSFTGGYFAGNSCSYSGVKQSAQPDGSGTATTNSNTTLTASFTVTASNCWIMASVANNGVATAAGSGTYLRQQGANVLGALYDTNGTVGTGTQSVTVTLSSANAYCISAASFAPATSAAAFVPRILII